MSEAALALTGVTYRRDGRSILRGVDWVVRHGERWVILGPNGSGKTTLVRIASMWEHPSDGEVEVLGHRLGRVDVRTHRQRVGVVSAAMADLLRPGLAAHDVVLTARRGALEPWWHTYEGADHDATRSAMARFGVEHLAGQTFATLSSGERQRVLLARALVADPGLLVLDEPMAGLDLGGREDLVGRLADLAADEAAPALVLVTHHVEEIPPGFTHALTLRDGEVVAAGPLLDVVTSAVLQRTFEVPVEVERRGRRWSARVAERDDPFR